MNGFSPVSPISPFRYWCQMALPTAYDDSLSYYELLNKVITQLNMVITSTNATNGNFVELKNYVDTYFTNLDVQNEINTKLDNMASDGTLSALTYNGIYRGADPTGVKDSTSSIQDALDQDGYCYLPYGTYLITEPIYFRNGRKVMRCDGTIKYVPATTPEYAIEVQNGLFTTIYIDEIISDGGGVLIHPQTTSPQQDVVYKGVMECNFTFNTMVCRQNALKLYSNATDTANSIQVCNFYGNEWRVNYNAGAWENNGSCGIEIADPNTLSDTSYISACKFYGMRINGANTAIKIEGEAYNKIFGLVFNSINNEVASNANITPKVMLDLEYGKDLVFNSLNFEEDPQTIVAAHLNGVNVINAIGTITKSNLQIDNASFGDNTRSMLLFNGVVIDTSGEYARDLIFKKCGVYTTNSVFPKPLYHLGEEGVDPTSSEAINSLPNGAPYSTVFYVGGSSDSGSEGNPKELCLPAYVGAGRHQIKEIKIAVQSATYFIVKDVADNTVLDGSGVTTDTWKVVTCVYNNAAQRWIGNI